MSSPNSQLFTEAPNGRIYEVIDVEGYPLDDTGAPCQCVRIDDEQRVEIAACAARRGLRGSLVAEAFGHALNAGAVWRLVPVPAKHRLVAAG